MAVSPPFAIAETLPADSDLISTFPGQEHPFRDTVESWLTFLSDPTTGQLKSTAFAFPFVIQNSGTGTFMQFVSTDAGAAIGPQIDLYRNSASPAVNDVLGSIIFTGNNSAAAVKTYGRIYTTIVDPVSTTEDGTMAFDLNVAGTITNKMALTAAGLSVTGSITASTDLISSQNFISTSINAIVATTGAGTVWLRPNGVGSSVGQMTVNSSGNAVIAGTLNVTGSSFFSAVSASGAISGTTGTFSGAVSGTSGTFSSTVTAQQNFSSSTANAVLATTGAGNCFLRPNGAGSTTGQTFVTSAGNMTVAGDITSSSDRRLKKSISTLGSQWANDMVREVQPMTFIRRKNDQRGIGFIAQDVEGYAPELIQKDQHGMLSLAYPNMVAILWKVVQGLQAKVEALEAK